MANIRDPNILEIAEICKSVSTAFEYARNCGLVVDVSAVGAQTATNCTYTAGCSGTLYHTVVRQLPKIRCNRCKKYRHAMNGPAVFGVTQTQQIKHSWLVNIDAAGRPQTELPLNARLMLIWCWARKMSQVQVKECWNGIIGLFSRDLVAFAAQN